MGISYRSYLLGLLMTLLAFNYLDRIALGLVLQDIKVDLHLSDTQLGLLSGLAFALFYSVMGIPIARWADRGNRAIIIAFTTALWSAAVALCAVASSFLQLMFIRIGAAVGEAGCIPPAHSLIADYFEREERPRAIARYMLGAPLALLLGYFAAGWFNQLYGWRATFIVLGLPGLLLAALARFTLKEPRKQALAATRSPAGDPERLESAASVRWRRPDFRQTVATLWSKPSFRHLLVYFSVSYFFGYGLLQWQPTFFIRSYGLTTGEIGMWFAAIYGLGCGIGVYLGGELASRYASANERLQLRASAAACAFYSLIYIGAFSVKDAHLAFAAVAVASFGGSLLQGPVLATLQTLVPGPMRALSIALIYLFANLVGMGLGPLTAGILSDAFEARLGHESLRYALLILCPGYFWAAWHLWRASQTAASDIAASSRIPLCDESTS